MIVEAIAGVAAVACLWFLLKKDPEPLIGIYAQPGETCRLCQIYSQNLFLKSSVRCTDTITVD